MAQATVNIPTTKDIKKRAKRRAQLVAEAFAYFDIHTSNDKGTSTSYSLVSAKARYLSNVVANY